MRTFPMTAYANFRHQKKYNIDRRKTALKASNHAAWVITQMFHPTKLQTARSQNANGLR